MHTFDKMHKSDLLSSNTNSLYNSDRVPLIHLDQLPKILICKWLVCDAFKLMNRIVNYVIIGLF